MNLPRLDLRQRLRTGRARWILGILLLLVVVRAAAPTLILRYANGYLADFSPLYLLKAKDLDLHIWRMAYTIHGAEGILKKDGQQFLSAETVNISLAWRELIRLHVVADVDVRQARLKLTTDAINAVTGYGLEKVKKEALTLKEKALPVNVARIRLRESDFEFTDLAELPPEQNFRLTQIEATALNLTPPDINGIAPFSFRGRIQDASEVAGGGEIRPNTEPVDWSVSVETQNFDLRELNPASRRMVPLSFKRGKLSLYVAARSLNGQIQGYAKPFLKDLEFLGNPKDFKNVTHFVFEIASTIGNFFLENKETRALATRVNFKGNQRKLDVDTGKAIANAIKNGFGEALRPGLDEPLKLQAKRE